MNVTTNECAVGAKVESEINEKVNEATTCVLCRRKRAAA